MEGSSAARNNYDKTFNEKSIVVKYIIITRCRVVVVEHHKKRIAFKGKDY